MIGPSDGPQIENFCVFIVRNLQRSPMTTTPRRSSRVAAARASACFTPETTEEAQTPSTSPASETESDTDSDAEDYQSDSEDELHGPCGVEPTDCDPEFKSQRNYLGKLVAKEFLVEGKDLPSLFWGEVVRYNQASKRYTVSLFFCHILSIHYRLLFALFCR